MMKRNITLALVVLCGGLPISQNSSAAAPAYSPVTQDLATAEAVERDPLDLTFTLPGGKSGTETVTVRMMWEPLQVAVLPGAHPYISADTIIQNADLRLRGSSLGFHGRILLSDEARGGPARGMGTPRVKRDIDVEFRGSREKLQVVARVSEKAVKVSWTQRNWAGIVKANDPIARDKDWTAWYGSSGNFAAVATDHELVSKLSGLQPVWKSHERFGSGKGQSPRYGIITEDSGRLPLLPSAGGSSPIVWRGNIYVNYFRPSGPVDEKMMALRRERAKAKNQNMPRWETELWRIAADDVIACIDGRSGRTLWRAVYPGAGANWHDSKAGPCNVTPTIAEGKLVAIGSTGRVYGLDAATGQELWQSSIGKRHFEIEKNKSEALAAKEYKKLTFNRDFGGAPTVAAGVVAMPDFTGGSICGLLGLDLNTGKKLWYHEKAAAEDATPQRYRHNDSEFFISGVPGRSTEDPGRIVCVEAKTGKIHWEINRGITHNSHTLAIWENYLIARCPGEGTPPVEKKAPVSVGCFKISPAGYEKVWQLPLERGIWSEHPASAVDGKLLIRLVGTGLHCVDIKSGKILSSVPKQLSHVGANLAYSNRRLVVDHDGSHSGTTMSVLSLDPESGALELTDEDWSATHAHGTSYHPAFSHPIVDGRMVIRGADAVYLYDLRAGSEAQPSR